MHQSTLQQSLSESWGKSYLTTVPGSGSSLMLEKLNIGGCLSVFFFLNFPNPLLRLSKCLKCDRLSRRGVRAHILHLPRRLLHLWRSISVVSLSTAIHGNALDPWPFHHVTAAGRPRRCCPEAALSPIFSGLHAGNADLINVAGLSTTGKGRENNGVSEEID